jgi:hypothetical protein
MLRAEQRDFRLPHIKSSPHRRPREAKPLRLPCTSSPPSTPGPLPWRRASPAMGSGPRLAARPTPPEIRAGDFVARTSRPPYLAKYAGSHPLGAAAGRPACRAPHGKSRRRRAYPQQIVTTRLLYCLQDPFAHLSRLQRI